MILIERIIGWFCIALAFSLFTPNASYLYYILFHNNVLVQAIIMLISVGYGTIHSSHTDWTALRATMLTTNIIMWSAVAYIAMTKGPLGPMTIVIIGYCFIALIDLYKNRKY